MASTNMKDLAVKSGPVVRQDSLATFVRGKISQTLQGKKGEEFVTAIVSLVSHNPALAKCDRTSLCAACLQAQSLGLSLNQQLGQAWIIPYQSKKKKDPDATFQIGYRGYIQLAIRSGQYRKLNVLPIKEGELKFFDPLNEDLDVDLIQNEVERANTPTIGYYAMFEYLNGFRKAIYWTREKMAEHAKTYSPAYAYDLRVNGKNSFWSKDFDAMACKTMLRQLISKWGVMSVDMEKALESDNLAAHEAAVETGEILDVDMAAPESVETGDNAPVVEEATDVPDKADEASEAVEVPNKAQDEKQPQGKTFAKAVPRMAEKTFPCPKIGKDGRQKHVSEDDCFYCHEKGKCPQTAK